MTARPLPAGRLPYEPLERVLRAAADLPAPAGRGRPGSDLFTNEAAARALGVTRRRVIDYRTNGIAPDVADRLAIHVGLHPLLVWGNSWLCAEIGRDVRRQARHAERRNDHKDETAA